MPSVLVTGATGFIGTHAVRELLARGFRVHSAQRHPPPAGSDVVPHSGDLLDKPTRAKVVGQASCTHLLHLAWETAHGRFWEADANEAWRRATLDLIERFQAHGGERCVLAGTCAEYDWTDDSLRVGDCREGLSPLRPATLYGREKLAVADWLAANTSLSVCNGRVFFLYGNGEDARRLVPSLVTRLLRGERAPLTAGTQIRDFLDVRDAGAAFAALVASDVRGAVNVGSGQPAAVVEVAQRIATRIARPELLGVGELPMRADDPPRLVADVGRLGAVMGDWPPRSLDDGLCDAIAWWADRIDEGAHLP